MSYTCFTCNSIIESCIIYNSNYYCSKECYISILKKCDFCFKEFNMIKTSSFYNEPYYFCSIKHMTLANPRIRFGVIGGPIGGHLGQPAIIMECKEPQLPSNPQYTAPAPDKPNAPPGLQKPINAPHKPVNATQQKPLLNASPQQTPLNALQQQTPLNASQHHSVYYSQQPVMMAPPVFRPYVYFY